MGKHAKATVASNMRKGGARAAAALGLATVGLLAAGPLASADTMQHGENQSIDFSNMQHGHSDDDLIDNAGGDFDAGLINVADNTTQVPVQVCNNNVPVNVLGVQVPLNDVAGSLGLGGAGLDGDQQGAAQASVPADNCAQESAQVDGH